MPAIGPVPFTGMLLADMGADVIRIERASEADIGLPGRREARFDVFHRGRPSVAVDLKQPEGQALIRTLAVTADALIEGFRPGVMERLGLGPDDCLAVNPRLVYGRMTGYGQTGPLSARAGHDIDYIALSGALHAIGRKGERPVPPLSLLGDFGGGAMFLAFGIAAALVERHRSGKGQVIDAAMTDGTAYLMAAFHALTAEGTWRDEREDNILDGAAPWYDTYETKDGKYVAVGAIERRFYEELIAKLGLAGTALPPQHDRSRWPDIKARFAAVFAARTRSEWEETFAGSDACVVPVLSIREAPHHVHNVARATFLERDGVPQPAPQPRFSRTPGTVRQSAVQVGVPAEVALRAWGVTDDTIARLVSDGVVTGRQMP